MAVFTDGWRYHADIVKEDCAKRQSILNTGRRVWTLSWHDVPDTQANDNSLDNVFCDSLLSRPAPKSGKLVAQYEAWRTSMQQRGLGEFPQLNTLIEDWVEKKNSFNRLLQWMSDPEKATKAAQALAFFCGMQTVVSDDLKRLPVITLKGMTAQALAATDNAKRHIFGLRQSSDRNWGVGSRLYEHLPHSLFCKPRKLCPAQGRTCCMSSIAVASRLLGCCQYGKSRRRCAHNPANSTGRRI